jgi:NADP-dependent 3-hydroxy acid dehydrogenase YdfG
MSAFAGQIALVTGASSGIGRAIALALAAQGATVALVGRNAEALSAVAAEIMAKRGQVLCISADLEREADINAIQARLEHEKEKLTIVVHSAGAHVPARWLNSDVETLDYQYRVNVRAPYLLTRLLLPVLIAQQGQVVFVNSSAVQSAAPAGIGQYAATKHALKALADSLRAEVNADGVRVVSVFPGRTAGPMQESLFQQEGREYRPERLLQPEDIASAVMNALLLPRTAEVTDLFIRPFVKA